jgi:hypothetical protein
VDSKDGKILKKGHGQRNGIVGQECDCDLVEFPSGRNPIGNKWLFKKKLNIEGKVEKYKSRLIAKHYS